MGKHYPDQYTLNQIFALNIKYLMNKIKGVTAQTAKLYGKDSTSESVSGAYYNYEVDPFNGLPFFPVKDVIIEPSDEEISSNDLTPTLTEINNRLSALETSLNALTQTVATNKSNIDSEISSIKGSISSLDTRVRALEG